MAFMYVHQFDVVAITETFLDQTIPDALIVSHGYAVFQRDRNRHGDGILVLKKSSLISIRHCDLESNCEMFWLELLTSRGKVNFVTYYHLPISSVDDLQHLITSVSTATTSHLLLILMSLTLIGT